MSLASQQSSWSAASGPITPSKVTTDSISAKTITASGVPITGLFANGSAVSSASAQTQVSKRVIGGTLSVSELIINTDTASGVTQMSDIVLADDTGAWEYTWPINWDVPPYVTTAPVTGSVAPIVGYVTTQVASGVTRFALLADSQEVGGERLFSLTAVGRVSNRDGLPIIVTAPSTTLSPSALVPITTGNSVSTFRIVVPSSYTFPADVDSTKLVALKLSWRWGQLGLDNPNRQQYEIYPFLIDNVLVPYGQGTQIPFRWDVEADGNDVPYKSFAGDNGNQYQTGAILNITPNLTQFFAFDVDITPSTISAKALQFAMDFAQLTYYSTLPGVGLRTVSAQSLRSAPAPVSASRAVVYRAK